jgi:hypothetical protein
MVRNYSRFYDVRPHDVLDVECYDTAGAVTCTKGTGQWIVYDANLKTILARGSVQDGLMDGEWNGWTRLSDSVKYIENYKKGYLISGTGFDRSGRAFPFKKEFEIATCRLAAIDYIKVIRSRTKVSKDASGNKISLDDIVVSFIIESDGQLSHFETTGSTDSLFKESVMSAVLKTSTWDPHKYFGIPMRTRLTFPLRVSGKYVDQGYLTQGRYKEEVLGF